MPATELAQTSLSGHERNKLFISDMARAFHDLSGVSGVDSIKDGRSFALWDYDRDGWQDIALANINAPVLELFRNNLETQTNTGNSGMLAVKCVGGNKSASASSDFSPRDGYGAKIFVKLDDKTLYRELHCGEGLAAQNSNVMIFGMGSAASAKSILIRWPSGKEQTITDVTENSLVTAFEDPADGGENGFSVETYRQDVDTSSLTINEGDKGQFDLPGRSASPSELIMYTSMGTTCVACYEHLPELVYLRSLFDLDQLAMYGVPVYPDDTSDDLKKFVTQQKPPYQLLVDLMEPERQRYQEFILESAGNEAIPATVITNTRGEVLYVSTGIPSVSKIRQLVRKLVP